MPSIILSQPSDLAAIGARWQALEAAAAGSFFQSWAWVGCLAGERYTDPVLLEARDGDRVLALGLFNRRAGLLGHRLWLGETGRAADDSLFVEHNGLLLAPDAPAGLLGACLRAARAGRVAGGRNFSARGLVLGGVDGAHRAAAATAGAVRMRDPDRAAPYVDFTVLPAGRPWLDGLSANTRQQLRRSARHYAAAGDLTVRRAGTTAEALDFLDRLAVLHQAAWTGRGRPGAFAEPRFGRFHRALIARAFPTGGVDLLCVQAGARPIGYLYNFRHRGRVLAYQSGFDYAGAAAQQKPGLTCHHLAIERYRREGMVAYDFLAGADHYKQRLANATTTLHWIEILPPWSPRAMTGRLAAMLARFR